MSMTVNALVTGLIVFRIFKVFQEVETSTADSQIFGGSKLQRVVFKVIESGMVLFSIQLARLVVTIVITIITTDGAANDAVYLIAGIHEMLNVIIKIGHCYIILLITLASLGYNAYHYLGAGVNGIIFPRREFHGRS